MERPRQTVAAALLACSVIRMAESQPFSKPAHDAIVSLGFEGTVLKRNSSMYRAGRQSAWQKHKARHTSDAILVGLRHDRQGHPWAVCEADGRRALAGAIGLSSDDIGRPVVITYSRVDANGNLREARATERAGRSR